MLCYLLCAEFFLNTNFVTWILTFYQLGVMHEVDNAYSI